MAAVALTTLLGSTAAMRYAKMEASLNRNVMRANFIKVVSDIYEQCTGKETPYVKNETIIRHCQACGHKSPLVYYKKHCSQCGF